MLLTLNLPTYSQRHHSPFPKKTGAEKSRQLLTSFQWFCCQWRFRKFFSIFPGSSFFVVWTSSHGFLGQKFGGWVDDIRTFPEVGVFFYRKESLLVLCGPKFLFFEVRTLKAGRKKGRAPQLMLFLRQHFSHDILNVPARWHPSWTLIEVESESNKVLTGNTSTVQDILSVCLMINGQRKNSNFSWFWQVGTYSLGSAQCHIQGQVIGAGLKIITEIGNKGLHIVTSFDWVQISIFSCPPNSGHAYEST